MIRSLPTFSSLVANFPDKHVMPTKALLDSIGGQVRSSLGDDVNTCAIRMSVTLNDSGAPIRSTPGVHLLKGAPHVVPGTEGHAKPAMASDLFMFRVMDVKTYPVARYGAGKVIYDGRKPGEFASPIRGATQGIIVFEWRGKYNDFGAMGHADLFRVLLSPGSPPTLTPGCVGSCYFLSGPMIAHLWETRP